MSDLVKCPHCDNEYANTKLMRALQRAERAEAKLAEVLKKKNDMAAELAQLREHVKEYGLCTCDANPCALAALTQENNDE